MSSLINSLDNRLLSLVKLVGKVADNHHLRAYLIGGCVRDLILEKRVLDLDFAIENDVRIVAQDFANHLQGQVVFHKQFLTAVVLLSDGTNIDFTTLRQESYPFSGALPVVKKGSLRDDLFRRDFSINAMAICINQKSLGHLVDEFDAMKDIRKKSVRVLHDQSFVEDPTRILRAVRFEQRLGFRIESHTLDLLKKGLGRGVLKNVKSQRLFEEFKKNLKEDVALRNIKRLFLLGFLNKSGWKISYDKNKEAKLRCFDKVLTWAKEHALLNECFDDWLVRLMILMGVVSQLKLDDALKQWSLTHVQRNKVLSGFALLQMAHQSEFTKRSREELFHLMRERGCEELLFVWACEPTRRVRSIIVQGLSVWRRLTLQINGEDLKQEKIPAGEIYKKLLEKTLYQVSLGQCQTKQEQLAYVRKLYQLTR